MSNRTNPHNAMGDVLGYARVSTGDQDVAGQAMRLEQAGALKVFTDVRSGRTMERPGLIALLDYARRGDTLARSSAIARQPKSAGSRAGSMSLFLDAVQRRLDDNPQAMRQRRETVEHPFGTIKARMGAMHFLMKTLPRVSGEMALHRAEQLASVTNRIHADVAQVLGAQIRQDFGVNVVVAKRTLPQ